MSESKDGTVVASAVKSIVDRFPREAKSIAIAVAALAAGLTVLLLIALVRIVVLNQSLGYAADAVGFKNDVTGVAGNGPLSGPTTYISTGGTRTDYQIGSGVFMRVLEGTTGSRGYVRLNHELPTGAVVLSFSVACQTTARVHRDDEGDWHTFLPITEGMAEPDGGQRQNVARVDLDVNPVTYAAGWGKTVAYVQFPITSNSDYGSKLVRMTLIYRI